MQVHRRCLFIHNRENCPDQMYPIELDIKDTTESNTSASYLDLLPSIGRDGQLQTSIYDKRDGFNFNITNSPIQYSIFFRLWSFYITDYKNDMSGLAPHMDILFWGQRDFSIGFPNRDTSRNAWKLNHIQWQPPPIRRLTKPWPYYWTLPYTECEMFP